MLRQSLYWRSVAWRKLPTGRASRTPNRGATPRQALGRRWASLALSVGRSSLLQWYRASRADQGVRPTRQPATIAVNPMTERLYYTDSYLREFQARVVERSADGRTVYLDRTLFYPASGGQPFDVGTIAGVAVVEVVDEEERVAHRLAAPLAAGEVAGEIDWPRRFDHMQQHSGQHLLSAVFEELFELHTVSFHLGAESATIDLEGGPVEARTVIVAGRRANQVVAENRALDVRFEDAGAAQGLRKASERE